jgi:two-component system heavy metal sensor histidine kinase CusS
MEELEGIAIRIDHPGDNIVFYISDNIRFPNSVIDGDDNQVVDIDNESEAESKKEISSYDYRIIKKTHKPENIENALIEWEDNGNSYRGMQFRFKFIGNNHPSVIATIALNVTHRNGFLNAFKSALIKFTIIAALFSGVLHWFLTTRGLQPLKALSKKAKLISGQDIKERMPVDNLPIEIAGLSETLNNMLDRLDASFQRLENFSSDIAHELRTPINNLMMQTQVTLSKARDKNEYLMALGSNAEEFQRLARMISDMLFLAKADNKQLLLSSETIYLEKEFSDLFEFYDALAEDRNVQLLFEGQARVQGDRLMLRRAFNNLISNALHHCFEGSEIKINIQQIKDEVSVEIINMGETIPKEVIPHIFDRFYRADKARTCSSFDRVGLGLAITKSIAEAHGGKLTVTSQDKLTSFKFTILVS